MIKDRTLNERNEQPRKQSRNVHDKALEDSPRTKHDQYMRKQARQALEDSPKATVPGMWLLWSYSKDLDDVYSVLRTLTKRLFLVMPSHIAALFLALGSYTYTYILTVFSRQNRQYSRQIHFSASRFNRWWFCKQIHYKCKLFRSA